jgi:glutamate racemase
MDLTRPIGIFDSGLGGLTVQKEILRLLPNESTVYFGDNGRSPYGTKSKETIIRFSTQIVRFLQSHQVKMIVIACNTASAFAYEAVQQVAGVPVIEVVTPGAMAAISTTRSRHIGIIGTTGTINSQVYERAIRQADDRPVSVVSKACPLFVGLAEEGWWDHPVTRLTASEYLKPLTHAGIDTLVLGCTHYPLLEKAIQSVMGDTVTLINSGNAVAHVVKSKLEKLGLLNPDQHGATHRYFTSDSTDQFKRLGSAFLMQPIENATHINIEQFAADQ